MRGCIGFRLDVEERVYGVYLGCRREQFSLLTMVTRETGAAVTIAIRWLGLSLNH